MFIATSVLLRSQSLPVRRAVRIEQFTSLRAVGEQHGSISCFRAKSAKLLIKGPHPKLKMQKAFSA
jgi:hypothetical protein